MTHLPPPGDRRHAGDGRARPGRVPLALVLVLATAVAAPAQPCAAARPSVNKTGFRAGVTVPWTFAPSPGGAPFPGTIRGCVASAFRAWTLANAWAGSGIRFVPGHGGIQVRVDRGGLMLPPRSAGGWSDGVRDADGFLERATIWLTADRDLIDSCDGVTKVVLHELGHLHGLADNPRRRVPSVMNAVGGPDDRRGRVPLTPTLCDAAQAAVATAVPLSLASAAAPRP